MKWSQERQVKIVFFIMLGVLAAVLLPLFVISRYNFMSVDDYAYSLQPKAVWEETHSVLRVLIAQIGYTVDYYHTWQGTYFYEWLATSLIGLLGKNAYYIGTYLCLGGIVVAEMIAFETILVKCLGADWYRAAIVAMSCICLQVLLTPIPVEAYYWFCGCLLYMFFHALAWVLVALLIFFYFDEGRSRARKILLEVGILFLCFAIGGSNYVTGLLVFIVHFCYILWMFYKKHPRKMVALCNGLFYLIAFMTNVLAPGNTQRLEESGVAKISAVGAIYLSFKEAVEYVVCNAIPPCIVLCILLIPLFWNIVKKKNYRYPWPIFVTVFSFCVFAAQYAPTMYTLQISGAGRIQNLYRFNYYVFLLVNEFYWMGWLWRRMRENGYEDKLEVVGNKRCWLVPGWLVGIVMMCLTLHFWGGNTVTTVSAINALRSGEAKQYNAEHQQRLEILEDDSIEDAYLEPFTVRPYLLYFGDLSTSPGDILNNKPMAEYFEKGTVRLKQRY